MTRSVKACVLGVVLLGLSGAASTRASSLPERTMYITFSRAVALPGVELPAGTYIFELVSPMTNATVVRVASRDRHKQYLMAFTNLVARPADLPPGQVVTLREASPGVPPSIKVWFPEGAEGREFIYRD